MRAFSIALLCGCIMAVSASGMAGENPANTYVGVKTCSMCHRTEKQGKQLDIWKGSKHSGAYKTLTSTKANEIAKSKGFATAAAETPECLQCHVITETKLTEKTFDMKDGVQCETCHGPGSGYKSITVMKDRAKAVAAGMTEYKDDAAIEAGCRKCHNAKSPTFKEFKFEEMWGKIKHPVPKKS